MLIRCEMVSGCLLDDANGVAACVGKGHDRGAAGFRGEQRWAKVDLTQWMQCVTSDAAAGTGEAFCCVPLQCAAKRIVGGDKEPGRRALGKPALDRGARQRGCVIDPMERRRRAKFAS